MISHRHMPNYHRRLIVVVMTLVSLLCQTISLTYAQRVKTGRDRELTQPESSGMEQKSQSRVALVIGNAAYQHVPQLANPSNDARDMAEALRTSGFEVIAGENLSAEKMRALIRQFGEKLSKSGGVGLFYYSGHGVQVHGRNYLIPVEADSLRVNTIEDKAVDVNRVLGEMENAKNELNIIILDACRSNPFTRGMRGAVDGLAQISAPEGTLIAYSTGPGMVADDGTEGHGLYTAQLLRFMKQPDLSLVSVFFKTTAMVKELSGNQQVPWLTQSVSIASDFYFTKGSTKADSAAGLTAHERVFWESIKNSHDPEDFRAYLKVFPNGTNSSLALSYLRRYEVRTSLPNDMGPNSAIIPNDVSPTCLNCNQLKDKGQNMAIMPNGTYRFPAITPDSQKENQEQGSRVNVNDGFKQIKPDSQGFSRITPDNQQENQQQASNLTDRGFKSYLRGDYNSALSDFNDAIELDPAFAKAFLYRADAYRKKGIDSLALGDYAQAISLDPNNAWAYLSRGGFYYSKKQYTLALKDFTEAINLEPQNYFAYSQRAKVYRALKMYSSAQWDEQRQVIDLTEAIMADPGNSGAYSSRGLLFLLSGQLDAAIRDSSRAIQLDPGNISAYSTRGDAYQRKGNYWGAVSDFSSAINLSPDSFWFYEMRARAYKKLGLKVQAADDELKAKLSRDRIQSDMRNRY